MKSSPPTAVNTVRGFQPTPAASGDEDSDYGASDTPSRHKSSRPGPGRVDDIVSANCSPSLRGIPSPKVSGIAKLRAKMEPLSLDDGPRSAPMSRNGSAQRRADADGSRLSSMVGTASEAGSDGSLNGSASYEVRLEHDFVSESLRDTSGVGYMEPDTTATASPVDGYDRQDSDSVNRKMTSDDFEHLRCLGKGTYGTVVLVKQRATGRLYAQKQLKKASLVVKKKLVEQTKTERQILESVNRHPFVVNLFYAFQDHEMLYLILEYGQGGELFTHLNTEKMFSEDVAAFYMGEMMLALSHLHNSLGVVYRDLKPENCLLDADGHLLLTDFGLSKVSADPTDTCNSILGTVEYMAPEVILGKEYGRVVDWWSFGALGYDLMTGNPPFRGNNHAKIQERIVKQKLALPYFLSADAKDLLTRLLRKEPAKRLGAVMPRDLAVLKKHRFFRKIDWARLEARELTPPIQPMITDPELAENFSAEFTDLPMSPLLGPKDDAAAAAALGIDVAAAKDVKDDPFGGFSFVAPSSLLDEACFPLAI